MLLFSSPISPISEVSTLYLPFLPLACRASFAAALEIPSLSAFSTTIASRCAFFFSDIALTSASRSSLTPCSSLNLLLMLFSLSTDAFLASSACSLLVACLVPRKPPSATLLGSTSPGILPIAAPISLGILAETALTADIVPRPLVILSTKRSRPSPPTPN